MWFIICAAILLFAALVLLLTGLVLWLRKIRSLTKKQPKKAALLTIIPILILLFSVGVIWLEHQSNLQEQTERVFGVKDIGTPLFAYEPSRSFNGDGYSLLVYELQEDVRKKLLNGQARELPIIEERFQEYEGTFKWSPTPIDKKYDEVVNFAVLDSDRDGDETVDLSTYAKSIKDTLSSEGGYFSFIAAKQIVESGGRPGNIDMYVIDAEMSRIYILKHDT